MKKILLSLCLFLAASAGQAIAATAAPQVSTDNVLDNNLKGNKRFTVQVSTGEGGSIEIMGTGAISANSVASATINTGEDVQLVITPSEGYELKTLYVDGADVLADVDEDGIYTISAISKNMSVSATFEALPTNYNVTITSNGNGTISILGTEITTDEGDASTEVAEGENVDIQLTPATGYVLESLVVNGEDVTADVTENNTYSLEAIAADATIVATFKAAALYGDVNRDGKVNSTDVVAIYNYIASQTGVPAEQADVNGDGQVNSTDVVAVYNVI